MPKRTHETKEERKLRKIRKLERKLEKYKDASPSTNSDDPEVVDPEVVSVLAGNGYELQEEEDPQQEQENTENIPTEQEPQEDEHEEKEDLPQEILAALGQGEKDKELYGEGINPEILKIISIVLTDGLEKEAHEQLSKASKIPINAKLLDAPKLNNELSGLLFNSMKNRDNLLKDRQQDLGRGIALIVQSINKMTRKDFDELDIIRALSDSVRMLSHLHHQYTQIRRKLIAPVLDNSLCQNLKENKRSEFLYSQLEESVKTSSAIKRTVNILKPKTKNYQYPRRQNNQAQNHQSKHMANNPHYKSGSYQAGQGQTYKPHHRSHPRPAPQVRPARRPQTSRRGGRARYP